MKQNTKLAIGAGIGLAVLGGVAYTMSSKPAGSSSGGVSGMPSTFVTHPMTPGTRYQIVLWLPTVDPAGAPVDKAAANANLAFVGFVVDAVLNQTAGPMPTPVNLTVNGQPPTKDVSKLQWNQWTATGTYNGPPNGFLDAPVQNLTILQPLPRA